MRPPSPATLAGTEKYSAARQHNHPDCWVCAPDNNKGLAINFHPESDGVVGEFACGVDFTGYPGLLHGGVTSALLDGAMTNCLLAHAVPGLTARLEIRYLKPVRIGRTAVVRAWLESSRGRLHLLAAELRQDGDLLVTAKGRFMDLPTAPINP